jgi:signal-transduction protein with cAMP-binding, CBS, and nucleotidyltransferase domain
MYTEKVCRLVWVGVVVVFGALVGNSCIADDANALALSDALRQVELFSGLTDAERDSLKGAATLRLGRKGERIIEQGKALDRMFILLEGQAEIRVNGQHIVTHSGQTLVGEIEFLDMLPASADVVLLERTHLIELNDVALTGLMDKQPRLGYVLMREIAGIEARRLRDSTRK